MGLVGLEGRLVTPTKEQIKAEMPIARDLLTTPEIALALATARMEGRNKALDEAASVVENLSYGREIDWWLNATKKEVSADACREAARAILTLKHKEGA